jgi:hypothetical protein
MIPASLLDQTSAGQSPDVPAASECCPTIRDLIPSRAVIVNPRAGGCRGERYGEMVSGIFQKEGLEVVTRCTSYSGHARDIAGSLDIRPERDAVCV